jgi:hypothetical protein
LEVIVNGFTELEEAPLAWQAVLGGIVQREEVDCRKLPGADEDEFKHSSDEEPFLAERLEVLRSQQASF